MKRKLTCSNYIIRLEKDLQENTPKIQILMFGPALTSHFWIGYHPPSSIHMYHVKYENTLACKRISWDSWGINVLELFYYFLYA